MLNLTQGTAETLRVGRRIFKNVYVDLDLENNTINCYIPEKSSKDFLNKLPDSDLKGVVLENLELLNGYKAKTLENLLVISYASLGPQHIGQTLLNTKFGLLKNKEVPYGFIPIKLFPENGYITLESNIDENYTEILLKGFYLPTEPPVAFQKLFKDFSLEVHSVMEKGIISFISVDKTFKEIEDIKTLVDGLEAALSFVQGREVVRKLIQYSSKIKIHFSNTENGKEILPSIPTVWRVDKKYDFYPLDEFISKFLKHWFKLEEHKRQWFKRLILSLVYAKTKRLIPENKLLNLMSAYELLKTGKTLDKNALKQILDITSCEAYFIINIRDKIMHGYTFEEAVNIAFERIKNEKDCDGTPIEIIEKLPAEEKMLHSYFALIYYLERFILKQIEYSGPYYNPLNNFTEEIVNEILIEDEDIINELAKR